MATDEANDPLGLESRPDPSLSQAVRYLVERSEKLASKPEHLWGSILLRTRVILELLGPEGADLLLLDDPRVVEILARSSGG